MTKLRQWILFGMLLGCGAGVMAQNAPASSASAKPAPLLDLRSQAPVKGDAQAGAAKAVVCGACHGPQGVAIAPNFPNLAGQSVTYLYVQLKAFKQGQRNDPVMSGQAATLSDEDMRNLAAYFASLPAKPKGQPDAASRGAQVFANGDPAKGIPPCQGCHGPAGQGPQPTWNKAPQPPWHTFPHLAGQSTLYVTKALGDFKSGARNDTSNSRVMHGVVNGLDDADIQALSTYIGTL